MAKCNARADSIIERGRFYGTETLEHTEVDCLGSLHLGRAVEEKHYQGGRKVWFFFRLRPRRLRKQRLEQLP